MIKGERLKSISSETLPETQSDPNQIAVTLLTRSGKTYDRILKIPQLLTSFIFVICLRHFFSFPHKQKDLTKGEHAARLLLDFIATQYTSINSIPDQVLQLFANNLINVKDMEPSAARSILGSINNILKWSIEKAWFKSCSPQAQKQLLRIYKNPASIPKNGMTDGTFPTLSEQVSTRTYDDLALLESATHFCLGFLSEYRLHRDAFWRHAPLKLAIEQVAVGSDKDMRWRNDHIGREIYDYIFDAVLASRSETLLERLLLSNSRFQEAFYTAETPFSLAELYSKLKLCVRSTGSLEPWSLKNKENEQYVTFEQLGISNFYSACEAEEICLRWLMATDRIQYSGQKNLQIEDIDVTPTHLTINFLKLRSKKYERTSTSFRKKTHHYKIFNYHKDLRTHFTQTFKVAVGATDDFFLHNNPFEIKQRRCTVVYRPIVLACTPSSNLYNAIVERFPQSKLFQEFFLEIIEHNTRLQEEAEAKAQDGGAGSKQKVKNITANIVAQTRAIVDPEKPKSPSAFDRFGSATADADATAHTIESVQSTYKIRSRSAHRLGRRSDFIQNVGRLQEEDARKVTLMMEQTKFVTINDISEHLGWDVSFFKSKDMDDFNKLISIAESHGYNCTPFGALTLSNTRERIVVTTPVTAALIHSFIEGCQIELAKSTTVERDISIMTQMLYAKMTLQRFDKRTIMEGKAINSSYNIPPAII